MHSELWDTDAWVSPSQEADVKARVRKRVRAIKRWRKVPPTVTALLVAALAFQALPPGASPTSLRVAGEGADEVATEGPPAESPSSTTSTTGSTTTTTRPWSPLKDGVTVDGPVPSRLETGAPPPQVRPRTPGEPLLTDPSGDARYRTCEDCPEALARTGPVESGIDLVSFDARCTSKAAIFRTEVADLDGFVDGDADELKHLILMGWEDGPSGRESMTNSHRDGGLELLVTRPRRTGGISFSGTVVMFADEDGATSKRGDIAGVTGRVEGNAIDIVVPFDAWAATAESLYPGRARPGPGARTVNPYVATRHDGGPAVDEMSKFESWAFSLCS